MYDSIIVFCAALAFVSGQECVMPKVSPHACCPGFMPNISSSPIMTECGMPPDASPVNPPPCNVIICLGKKMNIFDADNKLVDRATYISHVEPFYSADFKPLIGPSYDACIGEEAKNQCGQLSFMMCTKANMFKNCPPSVVVNNADCAVTKAFVERCFVKTQ